MSEVLVTIAGLGSVWRRRDRNEGRDPLRFASGAYFNTTGVSIGGKIRTRARIAGHIRFNSSGGFDPHYPLRMINSVFECAEPCVWQGENRVLFKRMLATPQNPDYVLVVVKSADIGHMSFGSGAWRSEDALVISFSECRDQQEVMLLMPVNSWLRSDVGMFVLRPFASWPWSGRLILESL